MKSNRGRAIWSLVFAVIFLVVGIFAYTNNYQILLFRVIPLNEWAFAAVAALFLAYGIFDFARSGKKDAQVAANFKQQSEAAVQAAIATSGNEAAAFTSLATPCTVNITHARGSIGATGSLKLALNGYELGELKNKQTISVGTTIAENALTAMNSVTEEMTSYNFTAVSGGVVNLSVTITLTGGINIDIA